MNLIGRKGKSDPYVIITLGAQQYKTPTINHELNPKWDYWCEVKYFLLSEHFLNFDGIIFTIV